MLYSELHEIQWILCHFKQHKMHMDETIIVSSIVNKLPSSWKDTKRTLKHKKEEMSLEELANHLWIEEEFRVQDESKEHVSKIHIVEDGESSQVPRETRRGLIRTTTTRATRRLKWFVGNATNRATRKGIVPVSYTHLTLPTKRIV